MTIRLLLLTTLALPSSAMAQISPVPPFVGSVQDGFESLAPVFMVPCVDIESGQVCSDQGTTALSVVSDLLDTNTGCTLSAHSGIQLLSMFASDRVTFTFDTPVRHFGGRFADIAALPSSTTVTFRDDQGMVLSSFAVQLPNGCGWQWQGWGAAPGWEFTSVEIVHDGPGVDRLAMDSLEYDLGGGIELGTSYCQATANSGGGAAHLVASGSASVLANQLSLSASPVPNQPGIVYYGPQQVLLPFGDGFRCVGGGIGRLPVTNAAGGILALDVDLTQPPTAATQITGGSTWNFQAWFRDPAAGASGFNLSDGLEISFLP